MTNRQEHLRIAAISASILFAGWVASASANGVDLFGTRLPTLCGFKLLTTWDCPGCGLTRSLILALHGEIKESYRLHLWGLPLLVLLAVQIPYRIFRYLKPDVRIFNTPDTLKKWLTPSIFLSILLPWAAKTIATAVIRYL